jgi:hypothetical protein
MVRTDLPSLIEGHRDSETVGVVHLQKRMPLRHSKMQLCIRMAGDAQTRETHAPLTTHLQCFKQMFEMYNSNTYSPWLGWLS